MAEKQKKRIPIRRRIRSGFLIPAVVAIVAASVISAVCMRMIKNETERVLTESLEDNITDLVDQKASMTDLEFEHYENFIKLVSEHISEMYQKRDELVKTGHYMPPPLYSTPEDAYALTGGVRSRDHLVNNRPAGAAEEDMYFFSHIDDIWAPIALENQELISTIYLGAKSGFMASYDRWSRLSAVPEDDYFVYDYGESEWYQRGLNEDGPFFTGVYNDSQGRGLTITIASPYRDQNGVVQGVEAADFDITALYDNLISIDIGEEGLSFAIGSDGKIISPYSDRNTKDISDYLTKEEIALVTGGSKGLLEKDDAFYVYAPIERVGWTLCVYVPKAVVLRNVSDMDRTISYSILLLALGASLIVFIVSITANMVTDSISQPMELLKKDMDIIAEGDLDHRSVPMRNDEIGDMSLELNAMVDHLRTTMADLAESRQQMEDANIELQHAARMKTDFLANMSHEIRTPMNAVIGLAEIALREDLPAAASDALIQIQKSGRNLLNIINDILDYSKIESGKMEIIPETYEPVSELNDLSNILSTRVGNKDIELFVTCEANTPHALYGDAMRIRQVLINLANNAIKFTDEGSVNVSLGCEDIGNDKVILTYHIKDTGRGIKPEDKEKLFSSFTQVDSRRNRTVEGTGLGLAISQRLVKAMGGDIGFDSIYGVGSDFWFTIPQEVIKKESDLVVTNADKKRAVIFDNGESRLACYKEELKKLKVEMVTIESFDDYSPSDRKDYLFTEYGRYNETMKVFLKLHPEIRGSILVDYNSDFKPEPANLRTMRRPVSTLGIVRALNDNSETGRREEGEDVFRIGFTAPDARILVVDDNEINNTVTEGLLAPIHLQIDCVLSGQAAIEKVSAEHYDIVFMDHMMPGLDGVDTTKIIRELLPDKKDLVIIALSANVMESARQTFLEAGMNDFVAKPVEIREIVTKLKKWLPPEKIIKGNVEDSSFTQEVESPVLDYSGLDSSSAIKAMGSSSLYLKIVEEYYRSGEEKRSSILKAYEDGDIKDFTIKVHALKSSSRQIGAYELGNMAEELEKAGNAGDTVRIGERLGAAMDSFGALLNDLSGFYGDATSDEEKPPITEEVLKEQFEKLNEACENLDMDAMEEAGEILKKYSWPDSIKEDMEKLIHAIDSVDSEACEELMGKISL